MSIIVLKVFIPATFAFLFGVALTPFVTYFLYKYKMWKPKAGKTALDGTDASTFNELHKEREVGTPRFGGVVVWVSVLFTSGLFMLLPILFPHSLVLYTLAFISRTQTWLPVAALAAGAIVGFLDDWGEVRGGGGMRLRMRLMLVAAISLFCAYWFYDKLEVTAVTLPFVSGPVELGIFFIPFFVCVALFIYASGVIDGIDGLAGGVFASVFAAYAGIAFFQHQYDLAALAATIAGGLLAFVWFNIPPARFYLSETGTMGLTLALTVIVFLSDNVGGGRGVSVLPVIAVLLCATVISNIVQVFWKRVFGRKLLRIAPLHHHFEALGWPPYKVTMRYWVVGVIAAIIGVTIAIF
jgi:phospho-N-acetylmuramoyl-pentapeptide-transferase